MTQHFLLSAAARSLSIASVLRMSITQAEQAFAAIRWVDTEGRAVCPHCTCETCYETRRPNGALWVANGAQVSGVVALAMKARPSVDFCGYWQRAAV